MSSNRLIDIKQTESSPTEPLTLAQVKSQLIITSTDDDTLLTDLITQARRVVEEFCAISIVPKTIIMIADLGKEWELPYGPVTGIQGVETRIGNEGSGPGTYQTETSGWTTDGSDFLSFRPSGVGGFNPGSPFTGHFQWGPYASPWACAMNRYRITYATGYNPVPDALKLAILNEIAYRYENRGEQQELKLGIGGICEAARILALPYQRKLWF